MARTSKIEIIQLKIKYFLLGKGVKGVITVESNFRAARYTVHATFGNGQCVVTTIDSYTDFDVSELSDEFIAHCLMVHDV